MTTTVTRRPTRSAVATAGLVAGAAAAGALGARRARYGASMSSRRANFGTSIAFSNAGMGTYASEEDEVADLFEKIGQLQEAALLPAVTGDLDELNVLVSSLPHDLTAVRQRGYVHDAQLEDQIAGLVERWDALHERVSDALYQQQTDLVENCNRLLDTVDRLYEPRSSRATVDSCWSGVRSLQSRIEAAQQSLTGMYDDFGAEMQKIDDSIDRVEWMLEQVEAAKFQLLQGEAPVRAAGAQWIQQGDDEGPTGLLYLTDQRLLFERKEEVATKKILFVKLKKETLHEKNFEAPVSANEENKIGEEREGFLALGKVEVLEFRFDHTAQHGSALFHLDKDDAESWEAMIGRVKSGEIDRARTEEAAAEAESLDEARSEIPTNCPNCNAPIEATVVRGMSSINCQYCGTVIQI